MKTRFSTLDIKVIVKELQRFLGLRVANVYDIDSKTYMIKVSKPDLKAMILIESGNRLHSTEFDWPKNPAPSGFSMKLRKHLRGRRLEVIQQFGIDRVVDLQFGSGDAAYHLVVELYDRGNLVLTDSEYTILNILRPRTDESQDVRFAVRETYPIHTTKQFETISEDKLRQLLQSASEGDNLKKILMPNLEFGPALLEHCLKEAGFSDGGKIGKTFNVETDFDKLYKSLTEGESILKSLNTGPSKGYIIQKSEKRPSSQNEQASVLLAFDEFHPYLFSQHVNKAYLEFDLFDKAVDEYFSKLEGQRLDLKALQQEKSAIKKLDNVRKDHEKRLTELRKEQEGDFLKGQLIEMNLELVDRAILIVNSALANQIDWSEINELVKDAQCQDDPVAGAIKSLKLDLNHITMLLSDPYSGSDHEWEDLIKPMKVEIDLGLSAYANSRRYFDKKKKAVVKEQKTVDSSNKAFKNAEKKTKQTLKDVATAVSINKTRKTYWFEKFLWFISSENFLVIGGRDQQQNELIVKRYMRPGDVYVHADLHGASSVIVKNTTGSPVPPKTLNEAGTMAICNSAAWDAKVVTSAWWVNPEQVSKTAPTGEYLTTGSFMIRGKKNYLPPSYLVYGFGFLFKLEESSVARHAGERKVRYMDEESVTDTDSEMADTELVLEDQDSDDEETNPVSANLPDAPNPDSLGDGIMKSEVENEQVSDTDTEQRNHDGTDNIQKNPSEKTSSTLDVKEDGKKNSASSESNIENSKVDDQYEIAFPDTTITLKHVEGDKFSFQAKSDEKLDTELPVTENSETQVKKQGAKLSAKQRREMKKNKKLDGSSDEACPSIPETQSQTQVKNCEESDQPSKENKSQPAKRGQKSKLKKMKEKYGDQDEEERLLRMEILASAGQQKESKKKKHKGKKAPVEKVEVQNVQQQQNVKKHLQTLKESMETGKTDPIKEVEDKSHEKHIKAEESDSDEEQDDKDDKTTSDDSQVLNSLTGLPVLEDELLFAIPVCAPYQAINNYKFKVKLLPGSSKKGKATKTALGMFMHEKDASGREKDLMRLMKDVDLSRNIPGKVKVLAPNLNKKRKK